MGQKNGITRHWARKGARPRAPHDQRTQSAYIFGAICPAQGKGAGLVMRWCNTEAMSAHLKEVSVAVDPGAHAVVMLDQAGWHGSAKLVIPPNITLLPLPPRSPELNPVDRRSALEDHDTRQTPMGTRVVISAGSYEASADPDQGAWLTQAVSGLFNYHAVPTNARALSAFHDRVVELWRRSLRRCSQRDFTTWERMRKLATDWLPRPRILRPWPSERFAVKHLRWEPSARIGLSRCCAGGSEMSVPAASPSKNSTATQPRVNWRSIADKPCALCSSYQQ